MKFGRNKRTVYLIIKQNVIQQSLNYTYCVFSFNKQPVNLPQNNHLLRLGCLF